MAYYKNEISLFSTEDYDDTAIKNKINALNEELEFLDSVYTPIEGTHISTDSNVGYAKDVEILGNTVQDANNLADIRSVGDKVEGQELYKIDVVSCGKNLLKDSLIRDFTKYTFNEIYKSIGLKAEKGKSYIVSLKLIDSFSENDLTNTYFSVSDYCNPASGTQPTQPKYHHLIYESKYASQKEPITSKDGYIYLCLYNQDGNTKDIFDKLMKNIEYIQLEEGEQSTPYEPYVEDKLTILSPVQLEKVDDTSNKRCQIDKIVCKNGVWGVEKWLKHTNTKELKTASFGTHSDGWYWVSFVDSVTNSEVGISFISTLGKGYLVTNGKIARFLDSANIFTNIEEFKTAIANGIDILHQTAEPQFIPLPYSQQLKLKTFTNKTNIHFETEIEGTIKAQVPKSLGATVNTHTEQIANLNKELDRVKKLEESTVSTVTTESFTTVEETANGYFEDVKLEGKTLVNVHNSNPNDYTFNNNNSIVDGVITINANGTYSNVFDKLPSSIKTDTEYTIVLDIISNTLSYVGKGFTVISLNADSAFTEGYNVDSNIPIGRYVVKRTTKSDFTNINYLCRTFVSERVTSGEIKFRITILEGDHTQNPPEYFEGLKSVGDSVDEVSVESVNENLFDINEKDYNSNNVQLTISGNNLLLTPTQALEWLSCSIKVRGLRNGETYNINCDCANYHLAPSLIAIYENSTNREIGNWSQNYFTIPIDTNVNDLYLRVHCSDGNVNNSREVNVSNIQIRKGQQKLPYVPHQSDKKTLLYYNPTSETWENPILREWDSIEKHSDGKYYYHKRSGEVVLNGSESDWTHVPDSDSDNIISFNISLVVNSNIYNYQSLSDKFDYKQAYGINSDFENFFHANNSYTQFRINKSKLSTQDVEGFKAWLQANPTTVVYQLAQEEVYECTNIDLITYANETNYIVSSGAIVPKTTLKVHNDIANVILLLLKKISLLEAKITVMFKFVLSGDYQSLAYELYPEDFDNIIETGAYTIRDSEE